MIATQVIKKKRSGLDLSLEEIQFFIEGYTTDSIPDYQMSSLLMAIFLNGMSSAETINLTQVMLDSGIKMSFPELNCPVDKHSTGGVGDKTSLILAPIVAACGVPVPMMSGRGLGHTGGTLDKLESIPGFNVSLSLENFKEMVHDLGLSFIGQTTDICPADKKIYSLRDVTATVESLPLICASIMSKKIAEGIKGLVLDVKVGSGAFMKTLKEAKELAQGLMSIGQGHNLKVRALISNMNQPLGLFCGNALEIHECLSILKRQNFLDHPFTNFADTEKLSVELAAHMISIAKNKSFDDCKAEALEALDSGKAYEKFAEVCKRQGGQVENVPMPSQKYEIQSPSAGWLETFNSEQIGVAGINLGAGRKLITDKINPVCGIELHKKIGDRIERGESIFTIHTDQRGHGVEEACRLLEQCFSLSASETDKPTLIFETL